MRWLIQLLLLVVVTSTACATDYYVSPTGDDGAVGSEVAPWATFAHSYTTLTAGDTLYLMDGTYDEALFPQNMRGTDGNPITFKAVNNYMAIIAPSVDPGTASLYVTSWAANTAYGISGYLTFEGLMVRGKGEHAAIRVNTADDGASEAEMTHHIIMKNMGAFGDANLYNYSVFSIGNGLRDSTFEDIFAYGYGRKAMQAHGAYRVNISRVVVRYDYWDGANSKPNDPRTTFSGYNAVDCVFENFIAINTAATPSHRSSDRAAFVVSGNHTPSAMSSSLRTSYLGMIALDNVGTGIELSSGGDANEGITLENILLWDNTFQGVNVNQNLIDSSFSYITVGGGERTGIRLNSSPATPITGIDITNNYAVDNAWYGLSYLAGQVSTVEDNSTVDNGFDSEDTEASYSPDLSVRFLDPTKVVGYERGATILNRYEDGTQTSTPLWPFPNEAVIKQHMCNQADLVAIHRWDDSDSLFVGKPAWCDTSKTLTEYVWEYTGASCPDDICNPVGPTRSAGLPSGEQPSGTTQVTMSLTTALNATCKYGADGATGVDYNTLANTLDGTGTTSHTATISGLTDGDSYSRAVRCQKTSDSEQNDTDYVISWSVASGTPRQAFSGSGSFSLLQ